MASVVSLKKGLIGINYFRAPTESELRKDSDLAEVDELPPSLIGFVQIAEELEKDLRLCVCSYSSQHVYVNVPYAEGIRTDEESNSLLETYRFFDTQLRRRVKNRFSIDLICGVVSEMDFLTRAKIPDIHHMLDGIFDYNQIIKGKEFIALVDKYRQNSLKDIGDLLQ